MTLFIEFIFLSAIVGPFSMAYRDMAHLWRTYGADRWSATDGLRHSRPPIGGGLIWNSAFRRPEPGKHRGYGAIWRNLGDIVWARDECHNRKIVLFRQARFAA